MSRQIFSAQEAPSCACAWRGNEFTITHTRSVCTVLDCYLARESIHRSYEWGRFLEQSVCRKSPKRSHIGQRSMVECERFDDTGSRGRNDASQRLFQ